MSLKEVPIVGEALAVPVGETRRGWKQFREEVLTREFWKLPAVRSTFTMGSDPYAPGDPRREDFEKLRARLAEENADLAASLQISYFDWRPNPRKFGEFGDGAWVLKGLLPRIDEKAKISNALILDLLVDGEPSGKTGIGPDATIEDSILVDAEAIGRAQVLHAYASNATIEGDLVYSAVIDSTVEAKAKVWGNSRLTVSRAIRGADISASTLTNSPSAGTLVGVTAIDSPTEARTSVSESTLVGSRVKTGAQVSHVVASESPIGEDAKVSDSNLTGTPVEPKAVVKYSVTEGGSVAAASEIDHSYGFDAKMAGVISHSAFVSTASSPETIATRVMAKGSELPGSKLTGVRLDNSRLENNVFENAAFQGATVQNPGIVRAWNAADGSIGEADPALQTAWTPTRAERQELLAEWRPGTEFKFEPDPNDLTEIPDPISATNRIVTRAMEVIQPRVAQAQQIGKTAYAKANASIKAIAAYVEKHYLSQPAVAKLETEAVPLAFRHAALESIGVTLRDLGRELDAADAVSRENAEKRAIELRAELFSKPAEGVPVSQEAGVVESTGSRLSAETIARLRQMSETIVTPTQQALIDSTWKELVEGAPERVAPEPVVDPLAGAFIDSYTPDWAEAAEGAHDPYAGEEMERPTAADEKAYVEAFQQHLNPPVPDAFLESEGLANAMIGESERPGGSFEAYLEAVNQATASWKPEVPGLLDGALVAEAGKAGMSLQFENYLEAMAQAEQPQAAAVKPEPVEYEYELPAEAVFPMGHGEFLNAAEFVDPRLNSEGKPVVSVQAVAAQAPVGAVSVEVPVAAALAPVKADEAEKKTYADWMASFSSGVQAVSEQQSASVEQPKAELKNVEPVASRAWDYKGWVDYISGNPAPEWNHKEWVAYLTGDASSAAEQGGFPIVSVPPAERVPSTEQIKNSSYTLYTNSSLLIGPFKPEHVHQAGLKRSNGIQSPSTKAAGNGKTVAP